MDYERDSTPMVPNGPRSIFIYYDDMIYEGCINSRFTLVCKGILVIIKGYTWDSEQVFWVMIID